MTVAVLFLPNERPDLVAFKVPKSEVAEFSFHEIDIAGLDAVIRALQEEHELPAAHRDHALRGNWADCRECHISPNWLLIYRVENNDLQLIRTGSHSDLFG